MSASHSQLKQQTLPRQREGMREERGGREREEREEEEREGRRREIPDLVNREVEFSERASACHFGGPC